MNKTPALKASVLNVMPFVFFLMLATLSVFENKYGLIAIALIMGTTLALLYPKVVYFIMIALLPVNAFDALSNVTYVRLVGLLLTLCLGLRIAMLREGIPKDDLYKYFGLLFIGGSLSLISASNLTISIERLLTYLSLFLFYFLGRYFLRQLRDINMSVNVLLLSTLIFQFLGVTTHHGHQRISAGVGDPNGYASVLDMLIPLAIYRAMNASGVRRVLYWGIVMVFILLVILTGSRGGYLGFLVAACVLLYHYATRRFLSVAVLVVFITGTVFFAAPDWFWQRSASITVSDERDSSITLRLGHYNAALRMFLDHPLTGVGLNNFQFNNRKYGDEGHPQVVHNTYLEVLTGGGLLCLLAFLIIEWKCWRKLTFKEVYERELCDLLVCLKASFAAKLTTGLFLSADYDKTLWFLFSLIASVYYIKRTKLVRRDGSFAGTTPFLQG